MPMLVAGEAAAEREAWYPEVATKKWPAGFWVVI